MMPTEGTLIDVDAIEARAAAASEGPWQVREEFGNFGSHGWFVRGSQVTVKVDTITGSTTRQRTAEFVAAAREDVPALVAEVKRLREVICGMYFNCKAGYANDAMSEAATALGMEFLEAYGRRTGEIGGDV